jgi:hypothetical protein
MTRLRRLLRRRLAIGALAALCALALAAPAGARTALEPGQQDAGSPGASLRLADPKSPPASSAPVPKSAGISLRLADPSSPPVASSAPRVTTTATDSHDAGVTVLAFVLSLAGAAILAACAAAMVTTRVQRRQHGVA